jgi:hypothetical protein
MTKMTNVRREGGEGRREEMSTDRGGGEKIWNEGTTTGERER